MAVSIAGSEFDDEGDFAETHEINVTPFIDVMLVLLIIFMVAAPLATVDVAVNLPASTAEPQPRPDKPIFLTLKRDLTLALGEQPIGREAFASGLNALTRGDKDGFFMEIARERDRRKICGLPPVYALIEASGAGRGELLKWQYWHDPTTHSVVTFTSMAFYGSILLA